jgi:hypothetical protein
MLEITALKTCPQDSRSIISMEESKQSVPEINSITLRK